MARRLHQEELLLLKQEVASNLLFSEQVISCKKSGVSTAAHIYSDPLIPIMVECELVVCIRTHPWELL
jgi:hypothetical protein